MSELIDRLRMAAHDIANERLFGWGNTCTDAADELERKDRELAEARKWDEARVSVIHDLHERINDLTRELAEARELLREVGVPLTWEARRNIFLTCRAISELIERPRKERKP